MQKPPPLWILCNPRTGSSVLCEYLNQIGKFDAYENDKTINQRGPTETGTAFGEWLRILDKESFRNNPPRYLKCIYHQFVEVFGSPNLISHIDDYLDGIKFILLKRRNTIDHAASIYFSEKTNKYHVWSTADLKNYLNIKIETDMNTLIKCIQKSIEYQNNWDQFIKNRNYLEIFYEDIFVNPHDSMCKILEFAEVKATNKSIAESIDKNRLIKMVRSEHGFVIELIKRKCVFM